MEQHRCSVFSAVHSVWQGPQWWRHVWWHYVYSEETVAWRKEPKPPEVKPTKCCLPASGDVQQSVAEAVDIWNFSNDVITSFSTLPHEVRSLNIVVVLIGHCVAILNASAKLLGMFCLEALLIQNLLYCRILKKNNFSSFHWAQLRFRTVSVRHLSMCGNIQKKWLWELASKCKLSFYFWVSDHFCCILTVCCRWKEWLYN